MSRAQAREWVAGLKRLGVVPALLEQWLPKDDLAGMRALHEESGGTVAAGLGGFAYADLDTPLFLAENPFRGGYELEGGRLSVARIESGHGVEPKAK